MKGKPESFHHQCKKSHALDEQPEHNQELHQQTIRLNHIAFGTRTCQQTFSSKLKTNARMKNKMANTNHTERATHPHPLGNLSFWQLNQESPVSAITAVSPDSIC